jgi:UPF0271 protein
VLDTSAFLAGFDPFSSGEEQVTVPKVSEEIRTNSMIWVRFSAAVESGRLQIKPPKEEYCSKIDAASSKMGDSYLLSETDSQLLALALEYKEKEYLPQIITDDYSIQNVAAELGIEFRALATIGIKRLLEWIRYCPACHKKYPANSKFNSCLICGTELKRKPKRTAKRLQP